MTATERSRPSYFLESLERGMKVLRSFDADHQRQTLSEVAQEVSISRATARRVLLTLVDLGYMTQDGRHFSLTPLVLTFGFSYLTNLSLPGISQPHLERVSRELGEAVSVAILDGADVVFVARTATPGLVNVAINVGTRFPAHATSSGRVLVANLSAEARAEYLATVDLHPYTPFTIVDRDVLRTELDVAAAQNWAVSANELEVGMLGVAVPIREAHRQVTGAVTVELPASRYSREELEEKIIPQLTECAHAIAADAASRR